MLRLGIGLRVNAVTEAAWLAATDPEPMFELLGDNAWDRKRRLFSVACCRRIWPALSAECERHGWDVDDFRRALELAERYADAPEFQSPDTRPRHLGSGSCACNAFAWTCELEKQLIAFDRPLFTAWAWASAAAAPSTETFLIPWNVGKYDTGPAGPSQLAELALHCHFLRDIFGNPSRSVAVDPAWLTSDVLALAKGIYEERNFGRMPILADALQDAGCDNDDILDHCRGPGPHVRGCYVLDLILGKS